MSFSSDLTDEKWELIRHHFEFSNGYGNRRTNSIRSVINAILYVLKTGCQWRQLPNDFPKWKTAYSAYMRWYKRGVWEKALDEINGKAGKPSRPMRLSTLKV